MREVAKSMVGFSWAVSLFSLQQLSRLMTPSSETPDAAVSEIDDVSRVVQSHLSESIAERFRTADEWQRRVVDAVFDAASGTSLDPRSMAQSFDPTPVVEVMDPRRVVRTGMDLIQRSVDTVRQAVPSTSSSPASAR